jgi:hypothetical protein
MPATVQYKSGYPSASRPIESSSSIAADGLVSASASFIVADASSGAFLVGSPISQGLFSPLTGARLSGLFVESRSIEKKNGLWLLRINAVGAVNPPIIENSVEVSPRSLNKTDQLVTLEGTVDLFLYFDYLAETTSASVVISKGSVFNFEAATPKIVREWNRRGFTGFGIAGAGLPGPQTLLTATLKILESETREERAGVVRITKTRQAIYE